MIAFNDQNDGHHRDHTREDKFRHHFDINWFKTLLHRHRALECDNTTQSEHFVHLCLESLPLRPAGNQVELMIDGRAFFLNTLEAIESLSHISSSKPIFFATTKPDGRFNNL